VVRYGGELDDGELRYDWHARRGSFMWALMRRESQPISAFLVLTASASLCLAQASRPDVNPIDLEPYVDLPLPDPITKAEIRRYSATLGLSEAQAAVFHACYESYLEQERQFRASELPALMDSAREMARLSGVTLTEPWAAKAYSDFISKGEQFGEKCRGKEQSLFVCIEPMLAESQLPALQ
jgi:hypothetical protein